MKVCDLALFIVGRNKEKDSKIHYELSVEDLNDTHILTKDHNLRVKIHEGQLKYYHYNFDKGGINRKLVVNFDGRYGTFEICIKRSTTRPVFSSEDCQYHYVIDAQ